MLTEAPTYRLPWRVEYWQRCEEWDPRSSPYIVDADGKTVVHMHQHVGHPGKYDPTADKYARMIVNAVNNAHTANEETSD